MYKMLTELIARRISLYLEEHSLLPEEQKDVNLVAKDVRIDN